MTAYAVLAPTACHQPVFVLRGSLWATSSLRICAGEQVFCADGPDPLPQDSWSIHLMGELPLSSMLGALREREEFTYS